MKPNAYIRGSRFLGSAIILMCIFLGSASITIAAAPTVTDVSTSMNEDTVKYLALRASGSRGETFTYSVSQAPQYGTVTINGSVATYTPAANWYGTDVFWWKARGSVNGDSNLAKATITVSAVNDKPEARSGIVISMPENSSAWITAGGTDIDGDALTCIFSGTSTGTISVDSGNSCEVTFTPIRNLTGEVTLGYRVSDGVAVSNTATISVRIDKVNDAPVATDVSRAGNEDTDIVVVLSATDDDNDGLTYRVVTPPAHGAVTVAGVLATHTPELNYNGVDYFTYVANDGTADSEVATVNLTVDPVNDAPVALDDRITVEKNKTKSITLNVSDIDGDALMTGIVTQPVHGTIEGPNVNPLSYTPSEDYVGNDAFTYAVSDGNGGSVSAVITLDIIAPTESPEAGVGEIVWQFNIGDAVVQGVPAVVNGITYVGSESGGTLLYAFRADGTLLDTIDIGMQVVSGVMAVGNRVIVNTSAADGEVTTNMNYGTVEIGLNDDGSFIDTIACINNSSGFFGRDGLPARNPSGEIIYTVDVQYPEAEGTSYLTAFNTADCVTRQAIALPHPGWGFAAPLYYPKTESQTSDVLIIGIETKDAEGTLRGQLIAYAVNDDGTFNPTPLWIIDGPSRMTRGASAISDLGMIFAGTDEGVFYGVEALTGRIVWQVEMNSGGFGTLSVGADNRTLYAATSTKLYALEAKTGATLWTVSLSSRVAVAVVGDAGIYVLGDDHLAALDTNGSELWSLPLPEVPVYGYMAMNDEGQLLFADRHTVYAVETESRGLATTSDYPNIRGDAANSGLPQLGVAPTDPIFDPSLLGTVVYDDEYCVIDGVSLKLDFHYPNTGSGPFPTLVYVHGGGFVAGDKSGMQNYVSYLNASGYAVASLNYRLAPTWKFPAQMDDIKCAIRYLRANDAHYNIDTERIGLYGESAGGYLVAQLGTASERYPDTVGQYLEESSAVDAVIMMWGLTDLTYYSTGFSKQTARTVFGTTIEQDPELFFDASPIKNVDQDDPPFMVIQGMNDDVVPADMSVAFADVLEAAGVSVTRLFVENARHGLVPLTGTATDPSLSEVMGMMADFFSQSL